MPSNLIKNLRDQLCRLICGDRLFNKRHRSREIDRLIVENDKLRGRK